MEESLVPIYSRDLEYYIDDGNVILLVETTLFKVHRSMLMKDESVFCGMFSLPTENAFETSGAATIPAERSSMDGQSDESPIRLPEITAGQFRALLWSLYALPADLVATAETQSQEHRFVDLATISHKYQFITMEKWALNTLVALYIHQGCAYDMLDRLTAVAVMCDYKPLLDIVLVQWRRSIGEGFGLLNAAEVFQRHGLHDLLGLTYLALLCKKRHEWPADNKHVIRLLNGLSLRRQLAARAPHDQRAAYARSSSDYIWVFRPTATGILAPRQTSLPVTTKSLSVIPPIISRFQEEKTTSFPTRMST
ncbi:BTB domain-containing protein [Salix suchowensis]|nr:BTB domain-containing protein [Salix suchowensis]